MKEIQMVDLKTQYQKLKNEMDAAILEVIESSAFINGPSVKQFQADLEKYLGVKHVIPCANGTDALQIAMMALGLKPGDEVITPSFTYIATTEVMALLGLQPVFVDVDPETFCIDPKLIEAKISSKTKAIVPVHLYGQAANMDAIMQLAKKHHLFVIEDNAQAIGCDYYHEDGSVSKTGTIGTIGCTSFFPSKNLGAYGDGGALCTNDDELAATIRMVANHGQRIKYHHERVGCNSRLDTIQAAVLRVKLPHLDEYCNARIKVADFYDDFFEKIPEIKTPNRADYNRPVFHQYTLQLTDHINRDELKEFLHSKGIPSMVYYPLPAHKQGMFATFGVSDLVLPVTDDLTKRVISLPIHTEMDEEQLEYICNNVIEFITKNRV